MQINIELDNPRFCDGCPCDTIDTYEEGICSMGYWNNSYKQQRDYNKVTRRVYKASMALRCGPQWTHVTLRPRACIKNHGR